MSHTVTGGQGMNFAKQQENVRITSSSQAKNRKVSCNGLPSGSGPNNKVNEANESGSQSANAYKQRANNNSINA